MKPILKEGVRSIGIDDGPFVRSSKGNVPVVGVIYRGGTWFDGLLSTQVRRDGWNATKQLSHMIKQSKFHRQLHYIILDGIALAGFNIIDLEQLHLNTRKKVLVAIRKKPNLTSIWQALQHLSRPHARMALIERAGPIHRIGKIYCQLKGMDLAEAHALISLTCTRSHLPEPLRVAHLINGGLVQGQSGSRA